MSLSDETTEMIDQLRIEDRKRTEEAWIRVEELKVEWSRNRDSVHVEEFSTYGIGVDVKDVDDHAVVGTKDVGIRTRFSR